ncbi:hypothetical protein KGM_206509 [Danaus plexippus plexippus]|uniref:Uncharacterized protein n=1 Tax=Danaus plexippus plexippus TaxID=278856 RepID=A0A212FI54_DANPL|nr:hypothetical protein KGM_206509 [Danaus plexippus plexippus]
MLVTVHKEAGHDAPAKHGHTYYCCFITYRLEHLCLACVRNLFSARWFMFISIQDTETYPGFWVNYTQAQRCDVLLKYMILLLLNEVRSQTELKECAAGVLLGPCHSLYYASVMIGNWMFSVQTLTSSREDEPRDNRHCYAENTSDRERDPAPLQGTEQWWRHIDESSPPTLIPPGTEITRDTRHETVPGADEDRAQDTPRHDTGEGSRHDTRHDARHSTRHATRHERHTTRHRPQVTRGAHCLAPSHTLARSEVSRDTAAGPPGTPQTPPPPPRPYTHAYGTAPRITRAGDREHL